MVKAINDATQSKMGDIYQYIIALKDCFALKKDETLLIEVQGDISTINKNYGLVQKEIKHHVSEDNLTNRDVDFWKTLANWYISYDEIKKFNSLVLYTTSSIDSNSKLKEWNNKTKEENLLY